MDTPGEALLRIEVPRARGERRAVFVLIIAFWLILKAMLLLRIELIDQPPGGAWGAVTPEFITFHLLGVPPSLAITYGIYLIQRRARRLPIIFQIALAVVLSAGGVIATAGVSQAINMLMATAPPDVAWAYIIRYSVVYGWAPYACYTAAILVLLYIQELRDRDRQTAELEIAAREERLRAMRYQVDPHLLFNALNSASTLILVGRNEAADAMLLSLARYYQEMLSIDPIRDITLEREIELQMQYLGVEQMRFDQQLRTEINVPDEARSALVPSFILQPLLENAVKYGVAGSPDGTTTIGITAWIDGDRLHVRVSDDGAHVTHAPAPSTGTGLRNVRERLRARFRGDFEFEAGPMNVGYAARFVIPLRFEAVAHA